MDGKLIFDACMHFLDACMHFFASRRRKFEHACIFFGQVWIGDHFIWSSDEHEKTGTWRGGQTFAAITRTLYILESITVTQLRFLGRFLYILEIYLRFLWSYIIRLRVHMDFSD